MRLGDFGARIGFSSSIGLREVPEFDHLHEGSVPGIAIVGDLADAPILKAAWNQGHAVASRVADELAAAPRPASDDLDVLVVGAGPAGIGAALACRERGLKVLVVERERPFSTVDAFPKGKRIYGEPREVSVPAGFAFDDGTKEDLVAQWDATLGERALPVHVPEEVLDVQRDGDAFVVTTLVGDGGLRPVADGARTHAGATNTYRARRVILAIGRRSATRALECEGATLDKVAYALKDPDAHRGRRVLVVGGGDSALEAAVATADAGATVTLSYRGQDFYRCKAKNKARVAGLVSAGRVTVELGTVVARVTERAVTLKRGAREFDVPNDDVLAFLGTRLPRAFLDRLGLRVLGDFRPARALWLAAFAAVTWLFYVLKTKRTLFPFGEGDVFGAVPELLKVHLPLGKAFGDRVVDGGFWGTVCYTAAIAFFGWFAYKKYPSAEQKSRYRSLVGFQVVFLFGLPELVAPLVIDRPWKVYAATVPWPLSIWSMVDAPSWAGGSTVTAVAWLAVGAGVTFVALPLYIRNNGERFCSWMCGCGGLAETLGDRWRHLAPRGPTAQRAEGAGRLILLAAIPVTLLLLNDAWAFVAKDALYSSKVFAEQWYGLAVDFGLASVLGVAMYPYLGNRVWCRFFCPLRAYMELVSKAWSRLQIAPNDKCIGCGECTRYCQMGIDVQAFAQRGEAFHNGNSACIHCGICVEVCPMDVLTLNRARG